MKWTLTAIAIIAGGFFAIWYFIIRPKTTKVNETRESPGTSAPEFPVEHQTVEHPFVGEIVMPPVNAYIGEPVAPVQLAVEPVAVPVVPVISKALTAQEVNNALIMSNTSFDPTAVNAVNQGIIDNALKNPAIPAAGSCGQGYYLDQSPNSPTQGTCQPEWLRNTFTWISPSGKSVPGQSALQCGDGINTYRYSGCDIYA